MSIIYHIWGLFFGQGWEQSRFFYLAAVGLLAVAMWRERSDVLKYKLKIENSDTSRAINYLKKKLQDSKENGKETVTLQEVSNNSKEDDWWKQVFNWLSKILFGTETKEKSPDDCKQIYNSWSSEHLVRTGETNGEFKAQVQRGKFVLLEYPAILQKPIPRSHWRFVPGILTAIGVLGTFYGITVGLADISLNNIGADSQNLLKSSVTLLEGMKTAFATSLVGLGLSSLFTLFLAFCDGVRRQSQRSLRDELEKIAVLETPRQLLSSTKPEANQDGSQSLADAAQKMGNAAEKMVKKFDDLINIQCESRDKLIEFQDKLSPQAIGKEVRKEVENFMQPEFKEIRGELTALRDIKAELGQEMLTKLVEKQREQLIEPIIAELKNSAELTKEASQAVKELGGISSSLSESIVTMQKSQVDTIRQLKQFAVDLEAILGEFRTDTKELEKSLETQLQIQRDSIKEFQNSTREIFAEQSTNLKQVGKEACQAMIVQREAFTASAQQTAATFKGIREQLEESLKTQAQIQRDSIKEFQNSTREIFAEQNTNLKQVGKEACQAMIVQREAFTASAEQTAATFRGICKQLEESLQTQAQIQRDSIQELDEQRQGLADVVAKFKKVFDEEYNRHKNIQEMQKSLIKIEETTENVYKFAHKIGLILGERMAQLQELDRTIGGEASRVEEAYKKLHENFNEGLKTWDQALKVYFKQKDESDKKFFTETDKAVAQVCEQLLLAANYLAAESNRKNTNEKD